MPISNGNHTDLVLYLYPYSFYSQKVVMSLHQKNLKFRPVLVDIHRGKQFSDKFLSLNPRGEVPVLVDNDVRIIPDSDKIIDYLDANFTNGLPRLTPDEPDLKNRANQLHQLIHSLKVEALTFGSAMHDDLELNPKSPFENPTYRSQMKEIIEHRAAMIKTETVKHSKYADTLTNKLEEIKSDTSLWQNREKYEDLLITFEKVMDECEAELASHENQSWWLCSPNISIADISLSILLNRLWQLGFERRMWERNRPYVQRYFGRVRELESFKKAISMTNARGLKDIFSSPIFWGFLGVAAVAGGGYYLWNKRQGTDGFFGLFSREAFSSSKGTVGRGYSGSFGSNRGVGNTPYDGDTYSGSRVKF